MDGWKLSQCNHQELREVLEFLVPLINPNKPKRMKILVASVVVDCLINKAKISWAKVFKQSIRAQVEKLSTVPVTYVAAYCLNLYQADELLTKTEKKAWKDLKWSLDEGNEWMGGESEEDKNPDEEDEETELDRDKGPTPDTTPRRLDRLAEPEKKPVDVRKVLQSSRFLPRMGEA
jgi:hypothetical protein